MSLVRQIEQAKVNVRKLKRACPYIFPEYDRLQCAKRELEIARQNLKDAKEAWKNLAK